MYIIRRLLVDVDAWLQIVLLNHIVCKNGQYF